MADETPRVVLFGNIAPINSHREVLAVDDDGVDVDDLLEREADPDDPVHRVTVDADRGIVGIHRREAMEGVSVTRFVPPESMGLVEAVSTALTVYASDHSNDAPEWVFCEAEPTIAEAIADHFRRQGNSCEVGLPDGWERKRSLHTAGKRMLLEAQGRLEELEPAPDTGDGDREARYWDDGLRWDLDSIIAGELDPWDYYRTAYLRTSAGRDFQSRVMGDTASNATGTYASATWIALTENATAPADGDTTLATELTTGGLGRAQAAYAHTAGANTYTLTKTFTSSDGSTRTINKVGVFNASSSGTMVFTTAVPSPPALVSGDSVTITETVSLV
jgi:hypothetical protein